MLIGLYGKRRTYGKQRKYGNRGKKSKAEKEFDTHLKEAQHFVNEGLKKQRELARVDERRKAQKAQEDAELAKEDEERRAQKAQEERARKKREKYGHTNDHISKI